MSKDELLSVRISNDLKQALTKAAQEDGRSMSNLAEKILREWLTSNSFLKAQRGAT